MPSPTVDIIVPVWNNPFETRACLASILEHSPEARLIIIDNCSSRETQLMLEEIFEPLEDSGLFISSERNIGLVPAINRGLAASDGDYAVIVRPNATVAAGWLQALLEAGELTGTGIVSPLFCGSGAPPLARPQPGCLLSETFSVSFSTLLVKGELHRQLGGFDESLDGGEWCLRDYLRRAEAAGYHSCVTTRTEVACSRETVFGSPKRRQEQACTSRERYHARWGAAHHYCLYFGPKTEAAELSDTLTALTSAARKGHRFTLLLHGRQFKEFRRRGWNALHTAITICRLPLLGTRRALEHRFAALRSVDPDLIPVRLTDEITFPGTTAAICLDDVVAAHKNRVCHPAGWDTPLEVV